MAPAVNRWPLIVGFVVNGLVLEKFFLQEFEFFPVRIIPPGLHAHIYLSPAQ
jgi:hypothetical protein